MTKNILLALLLVCSPLAAAEVVTAEVPVAQFSPMPDPNTQCSVFSASAGAYAVCWTPGGGTYRYELDAEGKPRLGTRAPYAPPSDTSYVEVDNTSYYAVTTSTSISVRRAGSDAEARIDGVMASGRLTWNRGSLLLLTYSSGGKIMGALIDTALRIVAPPFAILPASSYWMTASAGGSFIVATKNDDRTAAAAVVAPEGSVRAIALPSPRVRSESIATNGSEYLYVWERDREPLDPKDFWPPLAVQRYSPAGDAAGNAEIVVPQSYGVMSALWNGSDYVFTYSDNHGRAWMQTLGGTPQPLGRQFAYLASGPAGLFLTLRDWGAPETIRRLDTNGPEHILAYAVVSQVVPAMAMDGLETAVVWNDGIAVRISRIAIDGTPLDRAGVALPVDHKYATAFPVMAFDGARYLVAWISGARVNGLFFSRDGRLAGDPFVIGEESRDNGNAFLSIAWTGTHYLVTWESSTPGEGAGAIVTTSGSATRFRYGGVGQLASISGGPRPLVVYGNYQEPLTTKISGVFLDAAGEPFDIAVDRDFGTRHILMSPRVVSNGRDFLVTWILEITYSRTEAWVARLDDRGRLIGKPFLAAALDLPKGASAIPLFDGDGYRVVVAGDPAMPLFTARVGDAAFACGCFKERVAIPLDFDLAAQAGNVAAAASRDAVTVSYERQFNNDPLYGSVQRIFVRFVRTPPPPRRRAGVHAGR